METLREYWSGEMPLKDAAFYWIIALLSGALAGTIAYALFA